MRLDTMFCAGLAFFTTGTSLLSVEQKRLLIGLLIFMFADIVTGLIAAIVHGQGLSSSCGVRGLMRKTMIVLFVALLFCVDQLFQTEMIMQSAIYFYLAMEMISITENMGKIGVPIPQVVRRFIHTLKDSSDVKKTQDSSDKNEKY